MTVDRLIRLLQKCSPKANVKFWGRDKNNIEIYSEIKGIIKDSYGNEVNLIDEDTDNYLKEEIF